MAYRDLRQWIASIEEAGQLRRITAEVDWNLELAAIARRVATREGPALLFENIKDYRDTACRRLFIGGLGSRERLAMALNLPRESSYRGIVEHVKEKLRQVVPPVIVDSGPVKENIIKGEEVNLYEFPVPKYNHLDGGRYINTNCSVVTMDPDTKIMNLGLYRGMIGDNGKYIPVYLLRSQHWGIHFAKYERAREKMPVAVVYGTDPTVLICSAKSIIHPGYSEYEVAGALRGEPVELVKCETSDLYVPASAEIVVEGWISPDPKTFQMEGPFGEYTGFYTGPRQPKPVIQVECITYRDDPIFPGYGEGNSPGTWTDHYYWGMPFSAAIIWKSLESTGVPNITGVWGSPITLLTNLRISIDKIYRGHAKQVAAAFWGLKISTHYGKNLIVVDKDIDVFDDEAVEWALAYRTNAAMGDIQFFSGTIGSSADPSVPVSQRDIIKYGQGKWTRVLIDATVNWDLEPQEQYGGKREPPLCTKITPEIAELINRRWHEYGI